MVYNHGVRQFILEGRLHPHLQLGRYRSPSPTTMRTHTAAQGVRPLARSDGQPNVPTVQGGAANSRTLAAEVFSGNASLAILRSHSESSRPTSRTCWIKLGPLYKALGPRFNKNNNNNVGSLRALHSRAFTNTYSWPIRSSLPIWLIRMPERSSRPGGQSATSTRTDVRHA